MRQIASPHMHVVRKEEKESKLRDFILKAIAADSAVGAEAQDHAFRLIALSPVSPVARALASLADEVVAAGIRIEAVFAVLDLAALDDVPAAGAWLKIGASIRHAPDVRLLDAHEQLVLGPCTVWIGDCMRRDPDKRDAYECYGENSAETAAWALRSFDRIWNLAQSFALPLPATVIESKVTETPAMDPAFGAALEPAPQPETGATRH